MIVLLASCWDSCARALAERWSGRADLLTPADLSAPGWVQHLRDPAADTAVISGRRVSQREITGVLPLVSCVFEEELTSIVVEDRAYVAAEMTSFLLCWLNRLPCLVLNRPVPPCLSGPFWRPERWIQLAAQTGVPVQASRRLATSLQSMKQPELSPPGAIAVTVIGQKTFGEAHSALHGHALAVASRAGADVLEVQFSHGERNAFFQAAHTLPDLSSPQLADAVLALLEGAAQA